jgi:predicted N-acetyltransferase YhbS
VKGETSVAEPKGVHVRLLLENDIDFAYEMVSTEQWNDRKEDIKRMLAFEPKGCFIAEVDDKPVGHVFSVNYGKLGWIGLLIVRTECREMGIGTLLMQKAIDYLLNHGVKTAKLEAVPEVASLYRKLGFVDEYNSLRLVGINRRTLQQQAKSALPMEENEVREIARFDRKYFGADRTKVISALFQEQPKHCFVSRSDREIEGYVMCRKAESGHKLGPWVSKPEKPKVARELLAKCMSTIDQNEAVFLGVPAPNANVVQLLLDFGFEQCMSANKPVKSIRMRLGKKLRSDCVEGIFAIGGPMKG